MEHNLQDDECNCFDCQTVAQLFGDAQKAHEEEQRRELEREHERMQAEGGR